MSILKECIFFLRKNILFFDKNFFKRKKNLNIAATKARIAQLVEHDLAKVGVAGSSPVSRSFFMLFF